MPLTARLALPAILMASGCRRQKAATPETSPNKTETVAVRATVAENASRKQKFMVWLLLENFQSAVAT